MFGDPLGPGLRVDLGLAVVVAASVPRRPNWRPLLDLDPQGRSRVRAARSRPGIGAGSVGRPRAGAAQDQRGHKSEAGASPALSQIKVNARLARYPKAA